MKKHYLNSERNTAKVKLSKIIYFLLTTLFVVGINTTVKAQSNIYESYAILNSNGGGNIYYDLQANTAFNPDFQGANLGTFYSGNTLILNGGQNRVYVCPPDDITSGNLYYRIYKILDTPPTFINSIQFLDPVLDYLGAACFGAGKNQDWESKTAGINVFSGLTPGTYYLEVFTNADYKIGGVQQGIPHYANNFPFNYKAQFTFSPVMVELTSQTNIVCNGTSTGAIDITASGEAPYTYSWTGTGVNATAEDQTGLMAGIYSVIVTDGKGYSTAPLSITITQPAAALASSSTQANVLCFGNSTGAIDLTVTGGTGVYTYVWTKNGSAFAPTTQDLTGLTFGTYEVTITDANLCTATESVTITQPAAALTSTFTQTNVLCFGNSTGSIDLTVTGGTSPYTYVWSNGATTQDITGLAAGTYNVTITDNNGCTTTASATVTQPAAALASSTTQTNVLCFGNSTGSIDLTVTGGTSPYSYVWSNGATTQDITGLAAGTYNVAITDNNGCTTTASAIITQPAAALASSTAQVNVLCFGNATGSIDLTVTGGTSPYTYVWSNTATTQDITGLIAGTYNVTITDFNGCTTTASATITQPAAIVITATSNSVVCAGTTLNLYGNVLSGAVGTPTYSWTGPLGFNSTLQNPSIINVSTSAAGIYTLTVTNGNGCTITQTTTVIVNSVPNVSINPTFTSGFVKKATNQFVLYTYTITNIGSVPDIFDLSAVWINDNADSVDMDIRFKVGATFYSTSYATSSIPPGGTFTFQVELQVQGNAPRVLNHTKLTATSRICSISSISADMYTYEYNGQLPTASAAQLELSKTANTASSTVGVPFDYVITIVNNSSSTSATGVVISDQVPANLTITNNGGGLQSGQTITWNIGTLTKIGAGINTVQKTITVVPTCALVPTVTNTANVFSTPPDNGLGVKVSSITIPVTDNIAPTAICKPITVNLDGTGIATITGSMINNGSTDNCSIQSITISKSSFNCTNLGTNNVTLTVTDVSGNISTCTSVVTVVDNQTPVFTSCPITPASLCADNLTTYTKVGTSWDALVKDNCSFSLAYTLSGSTTGSGTSLNGVAFNVGATTVTWKATDTAGNTSNCIFTVTINGLPVIATQPLTQLDCEGASVNFTAVALGTGLTYIWQRKKPTDASFITIPIEGNVSYPSTGKIKIDNVGSAQSPSGTQYQVVIVTSSSGCSVTSSLATLLVNEITGVSPTDTSVTQCYGTNYSYTVSTSTPPPGFVVSYQWKSSVASGPWINVVNGTHFSGAQKSTLNIISGTPAESAEYKVQVIFHSSGTDCNVTTALNRQITFLPELTAPIATITQPDCITPTGSVTLSGLPAIGTWTLTRSPGTVTTTGTGTSTIITGLSPGAYTYKVTLGTCTSAASANVGIQAATTAIWNGSGWINGPPTVNQALQFTGSYTSLGDLEACSCTVTSGAVTFKPTHTLKITNWVHVNGGSLTFEDTASLVQINNVTNIGNITYKRQTTMITKMDYTYWSTPVLPFALGGVSPNTSGDKMYSFDSSIEDWRQESPATSMVPGVGYIIRGPQNYVFPNPPSTWEAPFVGVPSNGPYSINGVIADRSYLLGNPYPSALDADAFLDANQNVLDGTLYFWTHNTPIAVGSPDSGSGLYAYSGDDYASYNRIGGVSTAAQSPSSLPPFTGLNSNIPLGKIASGQGFFAGSKTVVAGFVSGTPIVYNNTMRVGVGTITGDNSQFFKTKNPNSKTTIAVQKHRVWLDLTNAQGAFKQTLVGYVADATNGYEGRFDGESYDGNDFFDFYSILQDKNLTIQGRALPFDENDEISLGYRVALDGTFSVAIGQTDGLLSNQPVFIEDKLTNTIFNLKGGKYTFNTAAGTFDDRFVLRYTDKTLSVDELEVNDRIIALYSNNYKTLIIRNNLKDATVDSVILYNIAGQKIANWEVKDKEQTNIQIPIKNMPSEIYIVKIKTTKGEFSKKIIIK